MKWSLCVIALVLASPSAFAVDKAFELGAWQYAGIGPLSQSAAISRGEDGLTVRGAGGEYGGRDDSLHFVYREAPEQFSLTVRVRVPKADSGLMAGVMLRESLKPGARHVLLSMDEPGDRSQMRS